MRTRWFGWILGVVLVMGLMGLAYGKMAVGRNTGRLYSLPYLFEADAEISGGMETLQLNVAPTMAKGAGWVLAIPGVERDARLAWRDRMEVAPGAEPRSELYGNLTTVSDIALATQIYPTIYQIFTPSLAKSAVVQNDTQAAMFRVDGLAAKVCRAGSIEELNRAMAAVGMARPAESMARMKDYADGRHCFVLVYIESLQAYEKSQKTLDQLYSQARGENVHCLEVRFASSRVVIPAHFSELGWTKEAHVSMPGYQKPVDNVAFRELKYYRGTAGTPWEKFTRAAYADDGKAREFELSNEGYLRDVGFMWLRSRWVFWGLVVGWTVLCSYLAGGVAGFLVKRRWREFAGMGLWNLLTVVGLRLRLASARGRALGMTDRNSRWFVLVFSVVLVALNLVVREVLAGLLG